MLSVTVTLLSVHPRTHRSEWEELSSTDSLLSPCSLWNTHTLFITFTLFVFLAFFTATTS